jgi:hypothetical protein
MTTSHHDTTAQRIAALIDAADAYRWLSWHGPAESRAQYENEADRLLEQVRRIGINVSRGRDEEARPC